MQRLAPALLFVVFVTTTFAALAASHALGDGAAAAPALAPVTSAEPTRLGTEVVAAIARDWLAGRVARDVERGAIELLAAPRELVVPAGEITTSVSLQAGTLAGGPVTVLVEALSEDRQGLRTVRSATALFRINTRYEVVVTTRDVAPRTILTAADVRTERRPFERVPPGALQIGRASCRERV